MTPAKKRATGPINFYQGFTDAVAANQRGWDYDRTETLGSSEAFGCHREAYFKKREPDNIDTDIEEEWGHTERGNIVENKFAVPMLRSMFGEDKCFYMGEDQKTFVDGRLSCTPDGIVIDQPRDALALLDVADLGKDINEIGTEVKSFSAAAAPKKIVQGDKVYYQAKPQHIGQVNVQLGMFNRKTNYKPEYGVVLYINPVKLSDIRPAIVKYDPAIYSRAQDRAAEVFDLTKKAKDFRAEGKFMNTCQYCKYQDACAKAEADAFPGQVKKTEELPKPEVEALAKMAKTVVKLRADFKALETEKKKAEADLKDKLYSLETTRAGGPDWSVSVSMSNGRKSFNKALAIEDGIDVDKYMTEGNPFSVMRTKGD